MKETSYSLGKKKLNAKEIQPQVVSVFNPFLHIHIYTHFNTMEKKAFGKHCGKR